VAASAAVAQPVAGGRVAHRPVPAVLSASVFYAFFVARTSFDLAGSRAFTLFDDAMISMTYARNLARGDGLVWNAGSDPVEGITNPLWTLTMVPVHLMGVPTRLTSLFVMVAGAATLVAAAWLAQALVARAAPDAPVAAAAAPWLVAWSYPLVFWTLRGMEVGLLALLVVALALFALRVAEVASRRDEVALGAVVVIGVSTRVDFVVFVAVALAFLAWQLRGASRRRVLALVGSAAVGALALQEALRVAYYGELVPNTYTLKVAHVPLADRLARGGSALVYTTVASLAAVVVCAGVAAVVRRRSPAIVLLAGLAAAPAAYSVAVGADAWEWMRYPNRFLAPGLVPLSCLAAAGASDLAARLVREARWRTAVAAILLVAAVLVALERLPHGNNLYTASASTAVAGLAFAPLPAAFVAISAAGRRPRAVAAALVVAIAVQVSLPGVARWVTDNAADAGSDAAFARFGRVLAAVTDDDADVAVVVAGAPIYFSDRAGVDLLGKSDERIADLAVRPDVGFWPGHSKWDYGISILGDRPDVVAQLRLPTDDELAAIEDAGYVRVRPVAGVRERYGLTPVFYAREDSIDVHWELLERVAGAGTATRGPA
jgi:hypothetical protein